MLVRFFFLSSFLCVVHTVVYSRKKEMNVKNQGHCSSRQRIHWSHAELIEKSKIRILYLKRIIAIVEELSSFLQPKSNTLIHYQSAIMEQSLGYNWHVWIEITVRTDMLNWSSTSSSTLLALWSTSASVLTSGTWTRCAMDHRMIRKSSFLSNTLHPTEDIF